MNDTSSTAENKFFEIMQQKTESERFFMGASMFDMAKLVTKASILEDNPDISPAEARIEFFYRWYWEDFDTSNREKILEALRLKDTRGQTQGDGSPVSIVTQENRPRPLKKSDR